MKIWVLPVVLILSSRISAQELTVEKIMRDPQWIGTSPDNVFWGADNQTVYFSWNPEKKLSDSRY